jgi:hypothetical protein
MTGAAQTTPSMNPWLTEQARRLEAASDLPAGAVGLLSDEIEALLEMASVAAHESGDRRNAPLLCYLVGVAAGKGAVSVDRLRTSIS